MSAAGAGERNHAPRLLVSVRNAEEARAAATGGSDWVDLKEPSRGALGPVGAATAREAVGALPDDARLSAAAGEWADWPHGPGRALLDVPQVQWMKLGLAGAGDDLARCHSELTAIAADARRAGKQLVLAAYADAGRANAPAAAAVRDASAALGLDWLLLDTHDKTAGGLLDHFTPAELARFAASCRDRGLRLAVAGRLRSDDFAALPLAELDMVGVRSAACGGDRHGVVDAAAVRALAAQLRQGSAAQPQSLQRELTARTRRR